MKNALPSSPLKKETSRTLNFRVKFKTEKCRFWYEKGFCPFNKMCAFAHSDSEIRSKDCLNFKYKTKPCVNFFNHGFCKYGERCQYLHTTKKQSCNVDKLRSSSEESNSTRSTNQSIDSSSLHSRRQQAKHRLTLSLLETEGLELLETMMQKRKRPIIFESYFENFEESTLLNPECQENSEHGQFQSELYSSLGLSCEKKDRLYSM